MSQDYLPSCLEKCLLDKEQFSRAYNIISARNRAWLKKHIAELSKWYNYHNYPLKHEIRKHSWTQGWNTVISKRPIDSVLVVLYPGFTSPAQLLSAVLPPKIAGVDRVLVCCCSQESGNWQESVLLALELAGVEEVYDFSCEQLKILLEKIKSLGQLTKLLHINSVNNFSFDPFYNLATPKDIIFLNSPQKCGIWLNDGEIPDIEALHFAHPDMYLQFWSQDSKSLQSISTEYDQYTGTWEDFCNCNFDLVFAPSHLHMQLLSRFSLVLTPGEECFWIWPDLFLHRFETCGLAFSKGS